MADNKKSAITISNDDFVRYLSDKNAESACEACGTASWGVVADQKSGRSVGLPLIDPANSSIKLGGIPVIALVCNNCGNTRLFWRGSVVGWMQEREGQSDG